MTKAKTLSNLEFVALAVPNGRNAGMDSLTRVHVSDGVAVATDRYRLHTAPTHLSDGNYTAKGEPIVATDDFRATAQYPNCAQVIPSDPDAIVQVTDSPRLLAECAAAMAWLRAMPKGREAYVRLFGAATYSPRYFADAMAMGSGYKAEHIRIHYSGARQPLLIVDDAEIVRNAGGLPKGIRTGLIMPVRMPDAIPSAARVFDLPDSAFASVSGLTIEALRGDVPKAPYCQAFERREA